MSLTPRVRTDLQLSRQVQGGQEMIVVKDPVALKYFRFGPTEAWLMGRMDGTRTLADIAAELCDEKGVDTSPEALGAFVRRLKELGLAERTQDERRILLEERLRKERALRLEGHGSTLTRMRFSFGDPDALFDRLARAVAFMFTPGFVVLSALAFLSYGVLIVAQHEAVWAGLGRLYDPSTYTLGLIVSFYGVTLMVTLIHELGHGLTCKHFGGHVHEAGAMLLYFSPAFYCNVNDAWTFDQRSRRLWVTFAGGWIELLLASAAAFVWILSEPGILLNEVAFLVMLVGGGTTLLLNFNPLIPMDGYYALMDYLEVPNLRPRSLEYTRMVLRRRVLGHEVRLPPATDRERRIFLTYGVLALAYGTLLITAMALLLGGLLIRWFGPWGWILVFGLALGLGGRHMRRAVTALRGRAAGRTFGRLSRRAWIGGAVGATSLVALLSLPWTVRVGGPASLEPLEKRWVRASEAGRLISIRVAEGDSVSPGDTLAVLSSPELELERARANAAMRSFAASAAAARSRGDAGAERVAELERASWEDRLAVLERRHAGLALVAPFQGLVVSRRPETRLGDWLEPGGDVVEIWSEAGSRVRIELAQRNVGRLEPGAALGVRFPSRPDVTWRTRVDRIAPSATEGVVELWAMLDHGSALRYLTPGMVGRAKVAAYRTTVGGALLRGMRRQMRLDFLL